jgi:uracil-DNA glycosylase family 4
MEGCVRVPGRGPAGARLFVLAEAPGRRGAARTGVPLTADRSGELFHRMRVAAGLAVEDLYVTNAVKCCPLDPAGRNRRPAASEAAACARYWRAELRAVRPRLAVALGDIACRQLTGLPLRQALGGLHPGPGGVPVLALYHPAYVGRQRYALAAYREDWQRVGDLVRAGPTAGARGGRGPPAAGPPHGHNSRGGGIRVAGEGQRPSPATAACAPPATGRRRTLVPARPRAGRGVLRGRAPVATRLSRQR